MGRTRDAFRRAGEWFAGEPGANAVGKFLTALLIVMIIAVILAIVYIGAANGIRAVREEDVGARLRMLIILVLGSIAVAAAIAVVPPLIRSLWEQVGWWTNVFRFLALVVIVFAVWVAAPLALSNLPVGGWFSRSERSESNAVDSEPVGIIPNTPHALPSDIASIRREAILQKYWHFLANYGDDGLRRRYERVKQWRSLTEQYANAAGLDATRVEAVMMTESAGQPEIVSSANARGLMQVLDDGARSSADLCGTYNPPVDMADPEKGICVGVDELRGLSATTYRGDWENVLAAYNWGIGNLGRALDRLQQRWPQQPRSFWSLWDKKDPAFVATLPSAETKGAKNPDGWILFNYRKSPNETRNYVPSVLAWEYIIRYMDAHDGAPPPHDGDREPPRVARRSVRSDDAPPAQWAEDDRPTPYIVEPEAPSTSVPTSNVWYTVRPGEGIGDVLLLFREPTETIVALNPDVVTERDGVAGARVRLPEDRYTFYRANGSESYRDIAARHGMPVAELLRWAGQWTAEQALLAKYRDCPTEGCADEIAVANAGEQLLVRRRN